LEGEPAVQPIAEVERWHVIDEALAALGWCPCGSPATWSPTTNSASTPTRTARYRHEIREPGEPKTSPVIDALNENLFMGLQVRRQGLLVAHSATARAFGGPEVREQFATRVLARYSMNAWRMLAPEIRPAPKSTKHPGCAQVVIGGTARETQGLTW
jgi:hypothetical protein